MVTHAAPHADMLAMHAWISIERDRYMIGLRDCIVLDYLTERNCSLHVETLS
jgi:hypothetical protein